MENFLNFVIIWLSYRNKITAGERKTSEDTTLTFDIWLVKGAGTLPWLVEPICLSKAKEQHQKWLNSFHPFFFFAWTSSYFRIKHFYSRLNDWVAENGSIFNPWRIYKKYHPNLFQIWFSNHRQLNNLETTLLKYCPKKYFTTVHFVEKTSLKIFFLSTNIYFLRKRKRETRVSYFKIQSTNVVY